MHSNSTADYSMPEDRCPACGYTFDAATRIRGDGAPDPGSITLCLKCGAVLEWDYAMRLHLMSERDLRALPIEQLRFLARAKRTMLAIKAERN